MMRNFLLTLTTTALIAFPAGADPSQQEVDTARSECRDAFLARDAEAYMDAAASMIAWGSLQNADLNRPGFTGGQNSRRIARYGTDIKEENREALFA